jgi:hypothetical protein
VAEHQFACSLRRPRQALTGLPCPPSHTLSSPPQCSRVAAITAAVTGCPLAVMTWLVTAATLNDGVINLKTTGQDYPM